MTPVTEMSNGKLPSGARRDQIVAYVEKQATVTTEELADVFAISAMTVWRDLTVLDDERRLRKIRGGAARFENRPDPEPFYTSKQVLNQTRKERIARYAAKHFVNDGDIIVMEAGTTVAAMAPHLGNYRQLTVLGNGLGTMNELGRLLPDLNVYCCGGMLRDVALTFVGPQAEEFFRHVNAKTCFLSATGLTLTEGLTDVNLLEIQVKRAMAASARQTVVLLDSTKFGARSFARVLDFSQVHTLITDDEAPLDMRQALTALGIDVHVA